MSPGAEIADEAAKATEEVQGHPTFVYRGMHFACSLGPLRADLTQELGGKIQDLDQQITIRKSAIKPIRTADQSEEPDDDAGDTDTGDTDFMPPHQGKLVFVNNRRFQIGELIAETEAVWQHRLVSTTRR